MNVLEVSLVTVMNVFSSQRETCNGAGRLQRRVLLSIDLISLQPQMIHLGNDRHVTSSRTVEDEEISRRTGKNRQYSSLRKILTNRRIS